VLLGIVNIGASILFVLGLSWGVAGVAAASILAEGVTLAAGAVVVALALGRRPWPTLAAVLARVELLRMLTLNRDILIRSAILIGTFAFFSGVGARMGDLTLAANAILFNVLLVGGYFLDGLAAAAEQLAGRAVGARYRPAFDATVRITVTAGLAAAGCLSLAALLGAEPFVRLMTTAEDVRAASLEYFAWAALAPFVGALAYIMDGLFIGATWSAAMRNMMILSAAMFLIVWLVATPALGNDGLWLALLVFLGARGVTLWAAIPQLARRTFDEPRPREK
jgi:MATE family multidrug resistance protein